MEIRRAKNSDTDAIMNLLTQVLQVHHRGRPDIFKGSGTKYTASELMEIIADDSRPVFVYDNDGVKGYAFCVMEEVKGDSARCDRKSLYIDDLCVDEDARGERIGSKLYEYVKNYAKKEGCHSLTLNVWECNSAARKFYEKQGLLPLKTTMEAIL